jgi:hypothetical protein
MELDPNEKTSIEYYIAMIPTMLEEIIGEEPSKYDFNGEEYCHKRTICNKSEEEKKLCCGYYFYNLVKESPLYHPSLGRIIRIEDPKSALKETFGQEFNGTLVKERLHFIDLDKYYERSAIRTSHEGTYYFKEWYEVTKETISLEVFKRI